MSREAFEEGCRGCKPVLIDLETYQPMSDDAPPMKAILALWETFTLAEKQSWHEFTCHNSREPQILAVVTGIQQRMQAALKAIE